MKGRGSDGDGARLVFHELPPAYTQNKEQALSGRTDLFPEQHSGLVSGIRAVLVAQEDDMDSICYSVFKPQHKDDAAAFHENAGTPADCRGPPAAAAGQKTSLRTP
ncbi:hypothetical protein EYF80_019797 [Liparis tanakae]|uniref:Uncharacterized protein n=1 Tax=Liparis tanakae TaxID=230148 RepID=A0A4Z2HY30_9TELE|nr:hypothetical protein EYF80_019797 [Liparis tanakae]